MIDRLNKFLQRRNPTAAAFLILGIISFAFLLPLAVCVILTALFGSIGLGIGTVVACIMWAYECYLIFDKIGI